MDERQRNITAARVAREPGAPSAILKNICAREW